MRYGEVLLEIVNLKKYFRETSFFGRVVKVTKAVDGISLNVYRKEKYCIVGESGSGKSTLARVIAGLLEYDEGEILLDGESIRRLLRNDKRGFHRRVQIVFQDPYSSINPRKSVKEFLERPLKLHGIRYEKVDLLNYLELVGLTPAEEILDRMPWELSGGQRQRLFIARTILLNPELLVADEPVSMLDVTIRAQILALLNKLYNERKMSIILIAHDILTASIFCDRMAVMYLGKIVEVGKARDICTSPMHPYTQLLVASALKPDPEGGRKLVLPEREEVIEFSNTGCRFYPRCVQATELCIKQEPSMIEVVPGRFVACHIYQQGSKGV